MLYQDRQIRYDPSLEVWIPGSPVDLHHHLAYTVVHPLDALYQCLVAQG